MSACTKSTSGGTSHGRTRMRFAARNSKHGRADGGAKLIGFSTQIHFQEHLSFDCDGASLRCHTSKFRFTSNKQFFSRRTAVELLKTHSKKQFASKSHQRARRKAAKKLTQAELVNELMTNAIAADRDLIERYRKFFGEHKEK